MTVTTKNKYNAQPSTISITDLTDAIIQRTDYDTRGEAETAREIAENAGHMLGRLIDKLAERGRLDIEDLQVILYSYDEEIVRADKEE